MILQKQNEINNKNVIKYHLSHEKWILKNYTFLLDLT